MKTLILYKITLLLFLLPEIALGKPTFEGKYNKEKIIKKEFNVNNDALLKINNSYGNLNIITYTGNKISIEVTIKVSGNDEEKVQKKLHDINVKFNASSSLVDATTTFINEKKSWWNWGSSNNVNMEINYVVKLPINNNVELNNNYGSIYLDKLQGRATINCDYGKITTKELMADNNILNFDYTKGCYFEYIKSGKINADYSGFTVSKSKNLDINADYSTSEIEVVEDFNYNCNYGNLNIGKANNINGYGDYLTTKIGDVYKNVNLKANYGSIRINKMTENAGNIAIESDYVGVKIGYAIGYHFDFDINLQYASLNDDNNLEFTKKVEKSFEKYYSGYHGSKSSGNKVSLKSEYGSITLFKN